MKNITEFNIGLGQVDSLGVHLQSTMLTQISNIPESYDLKSAVEEKLSSTQIIFPVLTAAHSESLNGNYFYYTEDSFNSSEDEEDFYGPGSYVNPYARPVWRDHDGYGANAILGRVIASYTEDVENPLKATGMRPGYIVGKKALKLVCAITDPLAISQILDGRLDSVSVGFNSKSIFESISQKNLMEYYNQGKFPKYYRGQVYNNKLSYWEIRQWVAKEISFVSAPADKRAKVQQKDLGSAAIQLLIAQKAQGSNRLEFADAFSQENVILSNQEIFFDKTFSLESSLEGQKIWASGIDLTPPNPQARLDSIIKALQEQQND